MISIFKKWKQYRYIAFVVLACVFLFVFCSFAFMCIGGATGWTSPSLVILTSPDSPIKMTNDEASWVASIIAIGGVTASLPYSYLLNKVGRQKMIVLVSLFYIVGWLIMIFATEVSHLYVGRYLLGAAVGCTFGSVPVFIGEVVKQNIRGAVVTFMVLSQSAGCLVSFAVGPVVSLQTLNIISLIFPVLMFICFAAMPESPYFLLRKGNSEEAVRSLMKFRGSIFADEVNDELKSMQRFLDDAPKSNFGQSLKQMLEPKSRNVIIIITVLLIGQQMTGIGAMTSYMQSIFDDANLPIKSNYAVLISELLADVSVVVTSFIMDSFGRKPLYSISGIVCTFSNVALALFYAFRSNGTIGAECSWIPMLAVFVLRMGYDFGMSAVPMVVTSEMLSFNIKGIASAYFALIQGAIMAVVVKFYQIIKDEFGQQYVHCIFAGSVVVSILFILYFMPETKNKSLSEIQEDFDKENEKKQPDPIHTIS